MGKRTGVYKYIHALPRDAYGNRYRIGGKVLSQKFGLGTVIGVAVAVCDALTLGAKASGFAATYDVVEVKKWTA